MDILRTLWSRLSGRTSGRENSLALLDSEVQQQTLARLQKLVASCPVCKQGFSEHSYALIAMAVLKQDSAKSAYDLLNDLSQHDWDEVVGYQDWDGSADDVLVFALRCSSRQIAVLVVEDAYELAYDDRVIQSEVLDEEESRKLESVVSERKWRPMRDPVNDLHEENA